MIDSPQNQHVKLFRSLAEAKHRRESGFFALEGRRLIEEALAASAQLVWAAYCPETFLGPEADRLLHSLMTAGVELHEITPRALGAMSHTGTPPGIAAVARIPEAPVVPAEGGWLLGLWEIRDPGNMGSMARIAHAFGAAAVLAIGDCVDFWDPKVVRASVGSVLHVPLLKAAGLSDLRALVGFETPLVAADMAAPLACDAAEYPERSVLLVGSEAHGLPDEALAAAQLLVRIPMPGGAESLNAAVAAGILAFQLSRKLGA
jgi:RNA methyltransferase, TrmH family